MYAPYTSSTMESTEGRRQRGLTREAIVARALEIGAAEGLGAVTLRRLAADLGVTPMALYRHVHDKQDLVNAMAEAVLEDLDVTAGFRPSMSWSERIRQAMVTYKEQMDSRPLALQLGIAYSGEGPPAFWRMSEALLGILLEAGFERRQALVLIRVVSNLLAGYVFLLRQDESADHPRLDARELDLLRRRVELAQLSLPPDEFPNLVESAADMADVWISDPDRWWRDTVDLLVLGLEGMLARTGSRTASAARA
jgi:TetR/AcrR family transcriptional regulator, tetracycline repressor protein